MSERFQIVGTEEKLSQGRAVGSPSANPKGGTFQDVGDSISMSRKPIHSPSSNPAQGSYQIMGSEANLSRTPVKGWGSAAKLTMSDAAINQSSNSAQKKGRK